MSSLNILQNYKSDNEDSNSTEEDVNINKQNENFKSILTKFEVNAAPLVLYSVRLF